MVVEINEVCARLWGDKFHRPEFTSVAIRQGDGANLVEGWMRADTAEALKVEPRPRDVPFRLAIPARLGDWDFHQVNAHIFYRLQNGESLMDIDYAPKPPPPVQAETSSVGLFLLGLVAAVVVGVALESRN